MHPRRALVTLAVPATVAFLMAGCSGSPSDPLGNLSGCLAGESGTIAIGVSNSSSEPIVIDAVELLESSGLEIIDRFIAIDEDARSTAVLFESTGRESVGGVDLDQTAIEPGAAAYIGVEVERTGSAEGRVDGLLLTVDGEEQGAPVTLDLRDSCD
ncbi:hypothetical protein [Microcella sp.]|uniref:hypothetical protein n=1 Tax=Microcella sp. TaxID=1913979 RepID=UPI00299F789B|nr:hypothetical protein [Microcella sp.]MDX2025885.1 hypothetical protein [Microcella sp.]